MCPTLLAALVLLQAPAAPSSSLAFKNVRSTYGSLGAARPVGPLAPGDVLHLAFDIDGLAVDGDSKANYVMAMDVTDPKGAVKYSQPPAPKAGFMPLGGATLPAQAFLNIGLDLEAGDYTVKVTVTDLGAPGKPTKVMPYPFTVGPKKFAIVSVYASVDERGELPMPTTAVAGQAVFVQFGVVGFQRNAAKSPDVTIEMAPLDSAGKETMAKPSRFEVKSGVDPNDPGVSVRFLVPLTRPGKYTIRLRATDAVAKQTAEFKLPLTVLPSE